MINFIYCNVKPSEGDRLIFWQKKSQTLVAKMCKSSVWVWKKCIFFPVLEIVAVVAEVVEVIGASVEVGRVAVVAWKSAAVASVMFVVMLEVKKREN